MRPRGTVSVIVGVWLDKLEVRARTGGEHAAGLKAIATGIGGDTRQRLDIRLAFEGGC